MSRWACCIKTHFPVFVSRAARMKFLALLFLLSGRCRCLRPGAGNPEPDSNHALCLSPVGAASAELSPRAVWLFRKMIKCTLPQSHPLLEFNHYGCYCGLGGSGTPVDELDRFIRLLLQTSFLACIFLLQLHLTWPCLWMLTKLSGCCEGSFLSQMDSGEKESDALLLR